MPRLADSRASLNSFEAASPLRPSLTASIEYQPLLNKVLDSQFDFDVDLIRANRHVGFSYIKSPFVALCFTIFVCDGGENVTKQRY